MAHDVFISYSSNDQKVVEGLSAYLEQNGVRCFVAYRDIPKGIVWAEAITNAIENCKLMIVVFSERFNMSKHVDREIEMCIEEGKPILTFKIENVDFKGVKKYYLKNINWVDAFPKPQEYFGEMLKSIQSLLPETKKIIQQEPEKEVFVEKKEISNKKETKPEFKLNKSMILIISLCVIVLSFGLILFVNKSDKNEAIIPEIENIDTIIPQDTTKEFDVVEENAKTDAVEPPKTSTSANTQGNTKKLEDNTEKTKTTTINFTQNVSIISTAGEVFDVVDGDYFKGEVRVLDGAIVSGTIFENNGDIKSIIFRKRNE